MKKFLLVSVLLIVAVGLFGMSAPLAAQEMASTEMDAAAVIEATYAAVMAQDLDAAGAYLAEDAVLVLVPPPSGTDGTFVGKEAMLGWFENLIASDFAIEFSDVQVDGDRVTLKNLTWVNDLPIAPVEFDGTGIVQDGLIKTLSWVMTPETMAKLDTAMQQQADYALVERILTEIWSEGNLDLADELVADDYVSHTWPVGAGRDDFKADVTSWREDFPGGTIVVDKIVFDANRAIILSHTVGPGGSLDEHPPEDEIADILVYQLENGRLSDRWYFAPFDPTQ